MNSRYAEAVTRATLLFITSTREMLQFLGYQSDKNFVDTNAIQHFVAMKSIQEQACVTSMILMINYDVDRMRAPAKVMFFSNSYLWKITRRIKVLGEPPLAREPHRFQTNTSL